MTDERSAVELCAFGFALAEGALACTGTIGRGGVGPNQIAELPGVEQAGWSRAQGNRSSGRRSKKPAASNHLTVSFPRYLGDARPTGEVTSHTCLPAAMRSSVICVPDWLLPTTSTAPSGRSSEFPHVAAWHWTIRSGSRPASAGTRGTFSPPPATTMVRA
jgi:hypothetical protein